MKQTFMTTPDRPFAAPTVQIDNERLRVTEWRFVPGAKTGWHRHAHDYVVTPMTTGKLLIVDEGGQHHANLTAGKCYSREAGVEHDVINDNPFEFVFIEIELK
jgi:quercetin dioxygenase-like cupin family protein